MKYQQIGGLATLVHHRGSTTLPGHAPDTSRGAAILCLHDAGGNGQCFADLMDALAEDHSPMSFDLPGHGRSGGLDALGSMEAMADHAATLLNQFGVDSVVAVGEGMGTAVAVELARRHAGAVRGIVAVGDLVAVPADDAGIQAQIEALTAITSGRARREFDSTGYAPDTDRAVYQKAFAQWVKTDPRATLGDRRAQAEWSWGDAPEVPTLVVIGEHTEPDARAAAEAVAAGWQGAAVAELAGAGRRGVTEQPAALAATINAFIGGLA